MWADSGLTAECLQPEVICADIWAFGEGHDLGCTASFTCTAHHVMTDQGPHSLG